MVGATIITQLKIFAFMQAMEESRAQNGTAVPLKNLWDAR